MARTTDRDVEPVTRAEPGDPEIAPLFAELGFREVSTYRAYRWVGR